MNMIRKKEESDTDFLARLMAEGFGEVNARFAEVDKRFDGVDARLDGVDARLDKLETHATETDDRLRHLERGQAQVLERLDSIDRKQDGMRLSLDEAATRAQVDQLDHRVRVLEEAVLPAA